MTSDKARTNKKWTSTEASRSGWERIFGKKVIEGTKECPTCGGTLVAVWSEGAGAYTWTCDVCLPIPGDGDAD
jgi:ribosomal protein S27AE